MGKMKKKTKPKGAAKGAKRSTQEFTARRAKSSLATKRPQTSHVELAGDEAAGPQSTLPRYPIVGIGASAGGLEALTQLLEPLPADTGVAIIIVQHLAPKQESLLSNLLSIHSQLPVVDVRDGVVVEPNQVYVVPPNTQLEIVRESFRYLPGPKIVRSTGRSTSFFDRSQALHKHSRLA